MRNRAVWTLEGAVLDSLGSHNLSLADRMVIHKTCERFIKEFTPGPHDTRDSPDYQEEDVLLRILSECGYEIPPDYQDSKDRQLRNLVDEITEEGGLKNGRLARQAFLSRRHGRISMERDGD